MDVTDSTFETASGFALTNPNVRVLKNPGNRGKGYSVRHGMREDRGEWRLFSDADLSAPIEELDKLCAAVDQRNVKVAIGSRAFTVPARDPLAHRVAKPCASDHAAT